MTNKIANRFFVECLVAVVCCFIAGFSEEGITKEMMMLLYVICNVLLIINSMLIWAKREIEIDNISSDEFERTKIKLFFTGAFVLYFVIIVLCLGMEPPYTILEFFIIPLICSVNIFCALINYYVALTKQFKRENYKNLLGVEEITILNGSDDIVVMGILSGKIKIGECLNVITYGENCEIKQTIVKKIEVWNNTGKKKIEVSKAKDTQVMITLENGNSLGIKKASVLYSSDTSIEHVKETYRDTLWTVYMLMQNMQLSEKDKETINICDCTELLSSLENYSGQYARTREKIENDKKIHKELSQMLANKILESPYIYTLISERTGEPYLYSRTYKDEIENVFITSNPTIILFTEDEKYTIEKEFDNCKIQKIDQVFMIDFLNFCFDFNGAYGVTVNYSNIYIPADTFNIRSDYGNIPDTEILISNPNYTRWSLLIGQLENMEKEYNQVLFDIYFDFLTRELLEAKFILPVKNELHEEDNKTFAVLFDSDNGRKFVMLYTDASRMRDIYNEEWDGKIVKIEDIIDTYDCLINYTNYPGTRFFVDNELFEAISKEQQIEGMEQYKS